MQYRTSEARAFFEHYDKLIDSIQEPDLPVLGARFFSRQIVSRETMEMVGNVATSRAVRASKLILAVMAGLDICPDKFESALDVLRGEQVYAQFSSMIKESCGEQTIVSYLLAGIGMYYCLEVIQLNEFGVKLKIIKESNYNLGRSETINEYEA